MANDRLLSPLALDVAISRVCIAAIKSKCGVSTTGSERAAATVLKEHLSRRRESEDTSIAFPETFLPDASERALLERTLADLSVGRQAPAVPPAVMDRVLAALDKLCEGSNLSEVEADELVSQLHRLGAYSECEEMPEVTV
ncbi:MAG: hypothetical protein HY763_04505 [Planctomycetes bacterium]|nr:hypothetical protein [Planctomycetota bacterium]